MAWSFRLFSIGDDSWLSHKLNKKKKRLLDTTLILNIVVDNAGCWVEGPGRAQGDNSVPRLSVFLRMRSASIFFDHLCQQTNDK